MPTHGLQMTLRPRNSNTARVSYLATATQQELDQCLPIGDDDTSCSAAGDCCCANSTGCTHRDDMSCDAEGNHHDSSPPKASISERFSYLSPSFLAKIRKKSTKRASEANQESKERRTKQGRIQQLPYLVNLIRGIFVSERRSRIPCDDLIGIIMKRHRNELVAEKEIYEQMKLLNDFDCSFFVIADKNVAVIDRSLSNQQMQ